MRKSLSVIIVTHNTFSVTSGCIASIVKFSRGLTPQIVVIDNASSDGTEKLLTEKFPYINYIYNSDNLGFSKAVNQGIRAASGEILLFLNSDTELHSPIFSNVLQFFKNSPKTGIMGGKIYYTDRSIQLSAWKFPNLFREFFQRVFIFRAANRFALFRKYQQGRQLPTRTDWVTGAFMAARSDVFSDIGLFDEKFFMYYEDTDLCKRAKERGWHVVYNPNISITHLDAFTRKKDPGRIYLEARRSQIYYYKKHVGRFQTRVLRRVVCLVMRANILRCKLKGRLRGKEGSVSGNILVFESVLKELLKKK